MNGFKHIIRAVALTGAAALLFASCVKEQGDGAAKAVLGDVTSLSFAARNAESQTVKVYADGEWHAEAPEWLSVDPTTGTGANGGYTLVTVTASDNADASGILEPRTGVLVISGKTLASRLQIRVNQAGDSYRNAEHATVEKIVALEDGKSFILDEATVAAVTKKGFVVTDGNANLYSAVAANVQVGDVVSFNGIKGTQNGLPALTTVEELTVKSHTDFVYPAPRELTSEIAAYTADAAEFIAVDGLVVNGNLEVTADGATYSFKQIDALDALSIATLGGNKVRLTGYAAGLLGANMFGIITTALEDKGPAVVPRPETPLRAKWRFTTSLFPAYADLFGGTAGIVSQEEGLSELYVPSNVEGNGRIQYYQVDKTGYNPSSGNPKRIIGGTGHPYVTGAWPGDYWLFSATDNYEYPAGTNLHIKFLTRISATGQKFWMLEYFDGNDWKPADEYPVQTETETGLGLQYNFIEPTANVAVECNWTLAAPCREPKFRMRCVANWQSNGSGPLKNPNGGTCRIADNDDDGEDAGPVLEVTDAPEGGGPASGTLLFADDFEWIEPWATASSSGDAVATNNPSTTAPNVFTAAACAGFMDALAERGYNYIWGPTADLGWSDSLGDDNPKVLYLQANYLKFGKTSFNAGLKLPALSALPANADVEISFDWCWQVTGAFKADLMTLMLDVDGGGSYTGAEITSGQSTVDGESKIEWQHVSATVSGAGPATRITIRPTNASAKVSNPDRDQNRWYLDNIRVVVK